jgi:nitrate/TMAO reductase-like tetraheme cytochrome c subunit
LPERDEWDAVPAEPEPEPMPERRFGRLRARAGRLLRPPRSRRGFLVVLAVVGGLGSLVAIAGVAAQQWTESAGFCTKCHTMAPEAKAYKLSVHHDVACGECHVGPGLEGFVKAKLNGARQTIEMLTGTFPRPIPPPDHTKLPDPKDTCMKCHSLDEIAGEGNPTKVVLQPSYREDRSNTRETVAVVVRPPGLSDGGSGPGAHWHVQQRVEFASPDEHSQKIDWVGVTYKNGAKKQFIARPQVNVSSDARPDIRRLARTETIRQMNCIDCHNRVGHELPSPGQAIDDSIAAGKISQSLPYIKREGVSRLDKSYTSEGEAEQAIDRIRGWYAAKYPLVWSARRRQVDRAVRELKAIYELVATPEMKAIAADYPNNLGHQSSPGCFRCHDGAHFEVGPKGRLLKKTIPWECTTCHTFPQVGTEVSGGALLDEPASHRDRLWVFNHKNQASSLEAAAGGSFCTNCHNSGAAKVNHDEMLYRHPQAIAKAGINACAFCHQEAFCARCHKKPVLESGKPYAHTEAELQGEGD